MIFLNKYTSPRVLYRDPDESRSNRSILFKIRFNIISHPLQGLLNGLVSAIL
jgi:hypothetical protein